MDMTWNVVWTHGLVHIQQLFEELGYLRYREMEYTKICNICHGSPFRKDGVIFLETSIEKIELRR